MNKSENSYILKLVLLLLALTIVIILLYTSFVNKIVIKENLPPIAWTCKRYLCPNWKGRLGNLMFEYASLYGIAKENNMSLVVTETDSVFRIFDMNENVLLFSGRRKNVLCHSTTILAFPRSATFEKVIIPRVQYVKIDGHLQSWKYFKNVENVLRQQFIFKQQIKDQAKLLLSAKIKNWKDYVTVGVHIRRGDMLHHYPVANKEYLQKASDYFRTRYNKVIFIVTISFESETRAWTLDNFVLIYKNDTVLIDDAPPSVHMYLLSSCNHTIITVGSFGWWVGWLNNGTTIYYDFFDGIKNNKQFTKADYIYPGWIGIKT